MQKIFFVQLKFWNGPIFHTRIFVLKTIKWFVEIAKIKTMKWVGQFIICCLIPRSNQSILYLNVYVVVSTHPKNMYFMGPPTYTYSWYKTTEKSKPQLISYIYIYICMYGIFFTWPCTSKHFLTCFYFPSWYIYIYICVIRQQLCW